MLSLFMFMEDSDNDVTEFGTGGREGMGGKKTGEKMASCFCCDAL